MKVIFLDVDGVLNSDQYFSKKESKDKDIDMSKVALLADIVSSTGAVIVLSSSWKVYLNRHFLGDYLEDCLREYALEIIDKTPNIDMGKRGKEIIEWINSHKNIENWVVLDDDVFDDYEELGILDNLVKTDFYNEGLTREHVDLAIKILNK